MSILEDLDLMDLLDVLPAESDFDLNDILSEFSTPGLFAAPVEAAPAEETPIAQKLPVDASVSEASTVVMDTPEIVEVSEPLPEIEQAAAPETIEVSEEAEAPPAEEEVPEILIEQDETSRLLTEVSAYETAVDREASYDSSVLFGDTLSVSDILYEFGTPTDDEGVKLYTPASQSVSAVKHDEDDVKVFVPEVRSEAVTASANDNTVLFDATALNEAVEPAHPAAKNTPGFFAKAAAAVMGLFASKKSDKKAASVQEKEPVSETDYLSLFTQDEAVFDVHAEEEVVNTVEAEAVEELVTSFDAEAAIDETDDIIEQESPVDEVLEEQEEDIPVIEAEVLEDDPQADASVDLGEILFELSLSEENTVEELPAVEAELSEETVPVPEEVPADAEASDVVPVTDTLCFEAVELTEASEEEDTELPDHTILFDAADLTAAPEPAPVSEPAKAPGFFAKAAAAVMGLFASKKAAKKPTPAAQAVDSAVSEDAFADLSDLFAEQDGEILSPMDDLLLELELQAEQEAEEAAAAVQQDLDIPVLDEAEPVCSDEEIADEDIPVFDTIAVAEEVLVSADAPEEAETDMAPLTDGEPEAVSVEEEPVTSLEEESEEIALSDILFELSLSEDDLAEELPVIEAENPSVVPEVCPEDVEIPDALLFADTMQFDAIRSTSATTEESTGTTLFDAIDLDIAPAAVAEQAAAVSKQSKAPGLLTKAVAVVMGLFASKKAEKKPVHTAAEEDPFVNLSDLFSEQGTDDFSGMDELMLELEMQVEREAALEAEAAAREAAERLAREEAQKALELEAQRLAQEEADAEAARARMQAEEEARIKAETDALLQQLHAQAEQQQALAEEELFDWIEAAEKRRLSAAENLSEDTAEPIASVVLDFPAIEESPVETNIPVYDYAAMESAEQTKSYAAPQMDIHMEEAVPEEVGDLLEMPHVEQLSDENKETPEEAAARKKKEDDALHYTPEESTAKTITTHIGNRFGAAFAAFANSDDDSDREEDLGPELPANKAYRFFSKYISGYRFRLRISAALCVILSWISLGLPVLGSLKNPAAAAAMCLMLLLTVMLAGADILATGIRTLIGKRPGIHSLVALSCVASVIDALVIIYTKGTAGYLPFCAVSAISMCFAIYGSLLYCRSQRLNFKTLDHALEPMTISVDHGIVEEDSSTVYRSPGHPEGYIHHSEEEDLSEAIYGLLAPIILPAIPVMAVIASLFAGGFGDFFHIMAAMFGAAASFSALIAFPLPYFLVQRDLYATKAAIAGWAGAREIGRVTNMIVTDRDLFPDDTVSIKSVRIVDNVPPQLTLSYMCSVIHHSGSCLVPAFMQLAENNDCELLEVENFQCHQAGGLSAEIGPDSVLVASHSYMKLQGFRIPARKKDSENALFLAVNGHVIAYIIVDYKPMKSVRAGLQSALRGNVEMIFAARDFNVTPLLIAKKFKSATETLRFPSYSQRYEMTAQSDSETATCAAVVYRKSFYSYAVVVEKARNLYKSVSLAVILSVISSIMGILLMFMMAITGAGAAVTVSRLLIFMLLWLVPTLALAVSMTK